MAKAIYQFLARQGAQRREEFQRETLIYTKSPSSMWCSSDAAFWEDESSFFGERRGYTPALSSFEAEKENCFVGRFPGVAAARQRRANFRSAFCAFECVKSVLF